NTARRSYNPLSEGRNAQILRLQRGHGGFGTVTSDDFAGDRGAAHALAGKCDHRIFQVRAAGVDVGRVSQTELEVNRRSHANQLGDFVVAHESANVIGRLDVKVDRRLDGCTNASDLRHAQIRRDIDGVGAQ